MNQLTTPEALQLAVLLVLGLSTFRFFCYAIDRSVKGMLACTAINLAIMVTVGIFG